MEYIEGQTLAAMIRDQGPMNARETIGVGIDLCSALSALHAAGLLHRDMKAHNVMREVGGRIVLMDFSGASTLESRDGPAVLSGTPLYMAPELFEGGAPSIPGDVYSLGVLLFFLLTGTVPVEGGTFAEIKEAHASRERRDLRSLRPDVAEPMVQVIERATSHDVATRYRTAGELERGLAAATGAQFVPPPVAPLPAAGEPPADVRLSRALVWTAALAGALAAGVVGWNAARHWVAPATEPPMAQFAIGPPYNDGSWPRLSPDGRLIAFGTFIEGRPRFFIRPIGSTEGRALLNTSARETPFWSPDNRTLAYFADGQLLQIDTRGGDPVKIADAPQSARRRLARRRDPVFDNPGDLARVARRQPPGRDHAPRPRAGRLPARLADVPPRGRAVSLHHPQLQAGARRALRRVDRRWSAAADHAGVLARDVRGRTAVLRAREHALRSSVRSGYRDSLRHTGARSSRA